MADFDSAWKEALDALFEPFMAFFFPDAHRDIDWAQPCEMLENELQKITPESEHGRRVTDVAGQSPLYQWPGGVGVGSY